jgi:hypothetical protein
VDWDVDPAANLPATARNHSSQPEIRICHCATGGVFGEIGVAHSFIANQIASTTNATTITAPITGVTRFELPLRGEALAA